MFYYETVMFILTHGKLVIGSSKAWIKTGISLMELGLTAPYSWNKYGVKTVYGEYIWEKASSGVAVAGTTITIKIIGDAYRLVSNELPTNIKYLDNTFYSSDFIVDRNPSNTLIGKYINGQRYNYGGSYLSQLGYFVKCISVSEYNSDRWDVTGIKYTVNGPQKGNVLDEVKDASISTYPENGVHTDGYWYYRKGQEETKQQGNFIGVVHSDQSNAYPTNGIHTDGYWYVRV